MLAIFKTTVLMLLLLPVLGLLLLFLFGAPIAVLWETYDLIAMNAQAPGLITDVSVERSDRGSTSQTHVEYQFEVEGEQHKSDRLHPGFLRGAFTGGDRLAGEFEVGKQCIVYYDSSNPSRCCLRYGWFQWSIGFAVGVWGSILAGYYRDKKSNLEPVAYSAVIYGAGLVFVGPITVLFHQLHLHLLAYGLIVLSVVLYRRWRTHRAGMSTRPTTEAE